MGAIFLSASIPEAGRQPYDKDAQPQLIQAAVHALATVVLGRRILVWGGHPAITPMLWAAAQDLGVSYAASVRLFQSSHWQDDFPEENRHFGNVTHVPAVGSDEKLSLEAMRRDMMGSQSFDAAVFVGGMNGILDEYALFAAMHPRAKCVPVAISGGATRVLAAQMSYKWPDDIGPLDFVRLFYRELRIQPGQRRT